MSDDKCAISVLIPVYNEAESIAELYEVLIAELERLNKKYEIIFVDDGSRDLSFEILRRIAEKDRRVRVIRFRRNFGQTAGISAGIDVAKGDVLVPMDADMQNHPADIENLLKKIDEGYDVVSGWRKNRRDPFFNRRLPSWIANKVISWATGVYLHDYGCTLKAYRKEVLKGVKLYGEMHRFIPIYAYMVGAKVTEIPVAHYPRKHGISKYGINRTLKVLLDLLIVKFLASYSNKPIYLYGSLGVFFNCIAFLCGVVVIAEKLFFGDYAHRNPLLLLAVFLSLIGIQFILMGVLAEIEIRTYHESQGKSCYVVQESINSSETKEENCC